MKQTKQFDYSKFSKEQAWYNPEQKDPACWGLHEIDGELHIDIARYKKVCNEIGITEFIPKEWEDVNEGCFIPAKKAKYDYYEKEKAYPHGIYSQPLSEVPCRVLQRTGEHS